MTFISPQNDLCWICYNGLQKRYKQQPPFGVTIMGKGGGREEDNLQWTWFPSSMISNIFCPSVQQNWDKLQLDGPTMQKVHSALKNSPCFNWCTVPITCLQCSIYMNVCAAGKSFVLKAIGAVHTILVVSWSDVKSFWGRIWALVHRFFFQKEKKGEKIYMLKKKWQSIDY